MFKKVVLVFVVLVVVLVLVGLIVNRGVVVARSGCCSGHSGVCGCQCCDGKQLSAVCREYYPECKENVLELGVARVAGGRGDDGWKLALVYFLGLVLVLFFGRMRYKRRKLKNN